jgi:cyclopropane fatty-acyl-phospholipid synthase-like methyltransferase
MLQSIRSFLAVPGIYKLWGDIVGGPACTKALVDEYIRPEGGTRILDIGCGPGTLVPYLPQSGYLGFDLSSEYIDVARKCFPQARFVCERVSKFSVSHESFDIVVALGIIHHLDDAESTQLFQIAYDALKPGGKLVTVDGVFTDNQSTAARWLLARDRGEHVRIEQEYVKIASTLFKNVNTSVRHDLLRIPYTHLIMECVRSAASAPSVSRS